MSCCFCKYWNGTKNMKTAECRRFPPNIDGRFPKTESCIVCGEFDLSGKYLKQSEVSLKS